MFLKFFWYGIKDLKSDTEKYKNILLLDTEGNQYFTKISKGSSIFNIHIYEQQHYEARIK